ncbi:hypothetical protein MRX96_042192 [Rhipicephalus microplus]
MKWYLLGSGPPWQVLSLRPHSSSLCLCPTWFLGPAVSMKEFLTIPEQRSRSTSGSRRPPEVVKVYSLLLPATRSLVVNASWRHQRTLVLVATSPPSSSPGSFCLDVIARGPSHM